MEPAEIDRPVIHTEIEGPRDGSLEHRASLALKILGCVGLFGVVLAMFPPATPVATLYIVTFNVAAAVLAVISLAVAFGLDRRKRWAVAAVRPLLVVVLVSGVYTFAVWLGDGRIRLPFDVALAVWALFGTADIKPIARPEARSLSIVGAALVVSPVMLFGAQLFGWGGAFDVHEADLASTVTADCVAGGSTLPDRITLTYEWSWSASSPMPSGTDVVVVGWTGSDSEGHPLYVIDRIPDSDPGVYSGLTGYPSTQMADQVAKTTQASFRWAIQLPEQRFAPGHVELKLRLARENPPGPTPLTVTVSYVHLGIWHEEAASVTCSA